MVILISRDGWGARPPKDRTPLDRSAQEGTAVHYTGADADEQADHANCAARVRGIQSYHMDTKGWADIAYSDVVCKHGYVFMGRDLGIRTAANGTDHGNTAYHAVCFLGDDSANRDDVTDPGRQAIKWAVDRCNTWAGVHGVQPHSYFKATDCPGDQLRAWIAAGLPLSAHVPQEDPMPDEAYFTGQFDRLHEDFVTLLRGPNHASTQKLLDQLTAVNAKLAELIDALTTPPPPPA
jgi:hypothetical protein